MAELEGDPDPPSLVEAEEMSTATQEAKDLLGIEIVGEDATIIGQGGLLHHPGA